LQTLTQVGSNVTLSNGGGTISVNDADSDPVNEIQDLQLIGNILTITNNGSATPVDLSVYRELPATGAVGQVLTWNGTSWVAQNSGTGADNWGTQVVQTDGTLTGDGTATSPLSGFDGQYSSLSGTPVIPTQTSQLTNDSGFITSPNDADSDPNNEIQNLSISGNTINISGGIGTPLSTNAPATSQVLTWNGTNWVAQNPGSGADNWGTQVVQTDASLSGDGTAGNPISVVRPLPASATSGQILTWNGTSWVAGNAAVVPTYAAGTGISITGTSPNFTITNSAPDQTVALTGSGATTVTGTYPNFTVASTDNDNQTLSIAGNSISISGGNSINLVSTAPAANQVLTWNGTNWIAATPATAPTYTAGTGININGSNVITNTAPDQTVVMTNGTGISITGTYPNFTVTNTQPNQTVALTGSGATTVSGTYPNFTIASTDSDNQNLSVTTGTGASANINISGGTGVSLSAGAGLGLAVSGTNVTLTNTSAALPTGTSDQTLRHDGTNWVANSALINNGADIGIGIATPQARLHVNQLISGAGAQQYITNTSNATNSSSALAFTNSVSSQGHMLGIDNTTGTFLISNSSININGNRRFQIDPSGNVGIGNFVGVTSRLDVDGQITMRTGATAGYVPVSNAAGTMTWTDPNSLFPSSLWSKAGTTIHPTTNGDFVSIGSNSANTALSIYGVESSTTINGNSVSPSTGIRIYNEDLTNNNFSSLAFATQISNGGNSEMAKIVGVNVDHTTTSPQGDLAFLVRNSSNLFERMRISGTGNVGIGTSTPAARLDVSGGNTYFRPNSTDQTKILVQDNNGTAMRVYTDATSGTPYDLVFGTFPSGHIDQLYLKQSSGNVGIGTTSPNTKLHVHAISGSGNFQLTSAATGSASTDGFTVSNDGNQAVFMSQREAADWYFISGSQTAMTIRPNLNVGIGITTPNAKLDVSNSTVATTIQGLNSFASATGIKIGVYGLSSGTGAGNNYGGAFDAQNGTGNNYGVSGTALGNSGTKIGVHGNAVGTGTNWAGYFEGGNVYIQNQTAIGTLTPFYALHVAEDISDVGGTDGAFMAIQNSNTNAGPGQIAGIRFRSDGVSVGDGRFKGGVYFQKTGSFGVGDLSIVLNTEGNNNNATMSDELVRFSRGTTTNGLSLTTTTNANAGAYLNNSTTGGTGLRSRVISTATGTGDRYGLYSAAWYGQSVNYGVYGYGFGGTTSYGIYGVAGGATTNWAGFFSGNVNVTGTLSKGGGTFKIDHPLDPENKILYHSFVESPDMMNIYNGNITTDANGYATVEMPEYFEALNKDFRYQLTVIGSFAQAIIYKKMENNRFVIQTNNPNVEVSWQITGVRKDPWAEKNRVVPEVDKKPEEKGKYLHPDAYGKPEQMGVDYENIKREEK
jgi:hypothetical protein